MKSTHATVLFAVGIAVGCAGAPLVQRAVAPAYAQDSSARRFQQFCTFRRGGLGGSEDLVAVANTDLKEKGDGGWELASTTTWGQDFIYCFKRPTP
jgi:hypothetical protein